MIVIFRLYGGLSHQSLWKAEAAFHILQVQNWCRHSLWIQAPITNFQLPRICKGGPRGHQALKIPTLGYRTRVLEACIWFRWESVPDFGNYTGWENFPMSLPKTPPYPQNKPSVRDMTIGSENRVILLTLWCLFLIGYLLFVSSLFF